MFSLLLISTAAAAASCNPSVQVLHLQEATSSWGPVLNDINRSTAIHDAVTELQSGYPGLEYAFSTFGDKNAPIHGIGNKWGIWKELGYSGPDDQCYSRQTSMSKAPAANLWNGQVFGGKDEEEAQWDALARATVDPALGWNMADTDADGRPIARIIVLFTDSFSHTATPESVVAGYGIDTSYRSLNDHYIKNFGKFTADWLVGSIISGDFAGIDDPWSVPPYDKPVHGRDSYNAYVMCNDRPEVEPSLQNAYSSALNKVYPSLFDTTYDKSQWDALCANKDALFPWKDDYKYLETSAIVDFPYSTLKVDDDCSLYEHPDPRSAEYANLFKGFVPVVVVTPPVVETAYDSIAFSGASNHCGTEFNSTELNDMLSNATDEHRAKYKACFERHYTENFANFDVDRAFSSVEDFGSVSVESLADLLKRSVEKGAGMFCKTYTTEAPEGGSSDKVSGGGNDKTTASGGDGGNAISGGVSAGVIAGSVIGGVLGVAAIAAGITALWWFGYCACCVPFCLCCKKKSDDEDEAKDGQAAAETA